MKIALLLSMLLLTVEVHALELVSPTGTLPSGGMLQNVRLLTLNYRGGLTRDNNTLKIDGNMISWTEESWGIPAKTRSAPLSDEERLQITALLDKEHFLEIRGTFQEANIHDAYVETLTLANLPELQIKNMGGLAPARYQRIERASMDLKARKLPESGTPIPVSAPPCVFRGLKFYFSSVEAGETRFSIQPPPQGQTFAPLVAQLSRTGDGRETDREAALEAREIDRLVAKINAVPWEEIAGTYESPNSPIASRGTRIVVSYSRGNITRSIEVTGLVDSTPSYLELQEFLKGLIAKVEKDATK